MKLRLAEILGPNGSLDRFLPDFEYRPSQEMMARAVWDAISEREHLCVEAGTGTGKTLAYLVPALSTRQRVVVSTATLNLQEQLLARDIPLLQENLFPSLTAACMKGRQNYLCIRRLSGSRRQGRMFDSESAVSLDKVAQWAEGTETGDRAELTWLEDKDPLWLEIDARRETCVGQECDHFADCWVTKMRQRAFEADVVVVNHALFFASLSLESDEIGSLLPDFSVLVLDEAHEVEEIAADYFGRRISNYQVNEFIRHFQAVFSGALSYSSTVERLDRSSRGFFEAFPEPAGRYSLNFFQTASGTVDLREELSDQYLELCSVLKLLYHQLSQEREQIREAETFCRRLDELLANLDDLFQLDDPDYVYWFERSGRGVFLHLTPINIARVLREKLFRRTSTVILTSATLSTGGNFEYIKGRLGLDEPRELVVPGEFNYREQTILYVPKGMPEPRSGSYLPRVVEEIQQLLEITHGSTFLLFTSFHNLEHVYDALSQDRVYPLFRQGEMPKARLLEEFKSTSGAVLCATASFWQGVDVRGDALKAVVIDKLPFQVPTEPLVAARAEQLRQEGLDPFSEYMIPAAIITLKQGLGRLIRSHQDMGILAVLDSRLRTRSYGELFLKSLPNCAVTDNIADLENFCRQNVSR